MPYFILAIAAATILLIGCGTLEERQERARNVLDSTKVTVLETVEGTKQATTTVTTGLTDVSAKLQETAADVQKRAETFAGGVKKITDGVVKAQEGIAEVKETLQPAGEAQSE